MRTITLIAAIILVVPAIAAGYLGLDGATPADATVEHVPLVDDHDHTQANGPPPPPGETYTGLQPIEMIFGGSLKHANTRVLLVPPGHGNLGDPTMEGGGALDYLEATLEGIYAWEPAIDLFVQEYPEYAYLDEITVQVELFEGETPETVGYDIIFGYVETAGGAFRGVAINLPPDTQQVINAAGLGDIVHYANRYILLSLFSSAPRAGQDVPDYPERHEVRGVTMHEFAHTWGLGHSTTWTVVEGPDLMNSPYPFFYGDGDPVGDGGERSPPMCITSLDLFGLSHLYRWLPSGQWERSAGDKSLPNDMPYEWYCQVHDDAAARAQAFLAEPENARIVAELYGTQ